MDEKRTLDRRQFLKTVAGAAAAGVAATPLLPALPAVGQDMMYSQAPMLDDMGLPPVEERLPANPRVMRVFEQTGQYGGTWRRGFRGISDLQGPAKLMYVFGLHLNYSEDLSTIEIVPGLFDEWSQNDDATEYTFHFREGMKWSDGHPFTTVDVQFWYDYYQNGELGSTRRALNVGGVNMELEVVDDYTFTCRFGASNPLIPFRVARDDTEGQHSGPTMAAPAHYLTQFIPDHENGNQALIDEAVARTEVSTWQELFGGDARGPITWWAMNLDVPVMTAWQIEKPVPFNNPMVLVRNPYFYTVDETGQQLPYVDRIEHALFEDNALFDLWITQGQIDMQERHVAAANFTLYKENEEAGDYRVLIWKQATTHAFYPNTAHEDPNLRALFSDARFREAMSIAIDRVAINELVYDGLLEPRMASPVNASPEYSEEFEKRWTEYDPERARALLDEIGLGVGDDGMRLGLDGQPLNLQILHSQLGVQSRQDEIAQWIRYWREVGLNVTEDGVERSLYQERARINQLDIGHWDHDRSLMLQADPRSYIGDSPQQTYARKFNQWRLGDELGEEPPADHPIVRIWALWEAASTEPDAVKRAALMDELIAVHAEAPMAIGTLGELPGPVIVSNRMHNVPDGIISDTSLRNVRVANPEQFFFSS